MNPKSRAHRILKRLSRYHAADEDLGYVPSWIVGYDLHEGEQLLGVYENNVGAVADALLITDQAVHIRARRGWKRIPYDQIASVETPPKGRDVRQLELALRDGTTAVLPVSGGAGRFRDAFPFVRYLNRVIGDLQAELEAES